MIDLKMKYTPYTLLRNGLVALPLLTALIGAATAYFLFGRGVIVVGDGKLGQHLVTDLIIGSVLGFLGGLTVSCWGQVALCSVNVEDDPLYKEKRRADSGASSGVKFATVYTKPDLEDHNRSTNKTQKKFEEKEKTEKIERSQILEIGTEGIKQKKREQLGIKSPGTTQSSGVSKPSDINNSGINKSGTKKK